jgi:hypothetical protein
VSASTAEGHVAENVVSIRILLMQVFSESILYLCVQFVLIREKMNSQITCAKNF